MIVVIDADTSLLASIDVLSTDMRYFPTLLRIDFRLLKNGRIKIAYCFLN